MIINGYPPAFPAGGGGGGTPWIISSPGSSQRNNGDYNVGCSFVVGAANITITDLGRWVIPGNSETHSVSLYTNAGALLATVNIDTSGAPGGFLYGSISPVVLTAGQTYRVSSVEHNGGDFWFNDDMAATLTTTADATIVESCYGIGTDAPLGDANANTSYVPPNFKYTL